MRQTGSHVLFVAAYRHGNLCLPGCAAAFPCFCLSALQYVFPADPTSPLAVFSKVSLDQVCMAPLMTSTFFAAMAYLEGCRYAHGCTGSVSTCPCRLCPVSGFVHVRPALKITSGRASV